MALPGAGGVQAQMALSGAFSVAESGAASYEIPLVVPPGTAGMHPTLSLGYNSQAGNGLLGVGWTISGLSAVTRCPKTVAQDGARGAVLYDANDRFCLDGQRLVAVSGAYGGDGTEYRTERNTFSRIISYGVAGNGPAWFQVQTKSGQTLQYGNTADSRVEAQGKTTPRMYAVNRIEDVGGNFLKFTYVEDTANADHYPSRIDYTGNDWSTPVLAPYLSVQFTYEARPDTPVSYFGGAPVKFTKRLKNVKTFNGASLVRDYRLAYAQSPSSQRSRITTISDCNASGACLPATTFGWQAGSNGHALDPVSSDVTGGGWTASAYERFMLDVNGDGKTDLVLIPYSEAIVHVFLATTGGNFALNPITTDVSGSGWGSADYQRFFGDVNGDGKADLILAFRGEATANVFLGNGSGGFAVDPVMTDPAGSGWIGQSYTRYFQDVNGDGKTDFVMVPDGEAVVCALLATTGGSFTPTAVCTDIVGSGWTAFAYPRRFVDVTGDGIADLVLVSNVEGSVNVFKGSATGAFSVNPINTIVQGSGWSMDYYERHFEDINGDGVYDFMMIPYSEAVVSVFLGKGDGTFDTVGVSSDVTGGGWTSSAYPRRFADVNGDGLKDLVLISEFEATVSAFLAKGDGTFVLDPVHTDITGSGWTAVAYKRFLEDVDGDGKYDFVQITESEAVANVSRSLSPSDLIVSITDGLGGATNVVYKPLTDSTVYTKQTNAVYPVVDFQGPMFAVSSYTTSNGIGGSYQVIRKYLGGKLDVNGRGFLGYSAIQTNDALGIATVSSYRQDWPYTGLPSQVRRHRPDGTLISQVDNTYAHTATGGVYFPYVSVSSDTSYEAGVFVNRARTTNQFDSFGNPTSIVIAHVNADNTATGYSKTTTNTYVNDTVSWHWILGRLTTSTVTSTTP